MHHDGIWVNQSLLYDHLLSFPQPLLPLHRHDQRPAEEKSILILWEEEEKEDKEEKSMLIL